MFTSQYLFSKTIFLINQLDGYEFNYAPINVAKEAKSLLQL